MKRIYTLALTLCITAGAMHAQGEMDAYKMSRNDLTGTARSVSMGGAFGALGGDLTGIAINPAGIGVYTRSEAAATLNFSNTSAKTSFTGNPGKDNKFKVDLDNFGLVGVFDLHNDDVPTLNFGFTYNRLKNFNRTYSSHGRGLGANSTMVDYMASRANGKHASDLMLASDYYPFDENDWTSVLGYSSNLIQETSSGSKTYTRNRSLVGLNANSDLRVQEKGSINSYDFNVGTTISDMLSLGLTVAVTDIDYKMFSSYTEAFAQGSTGYYDLVNRMKTEGTGWQVKLGAIYKPINELRIGVSYHSPTWYKMTDYFNADMSYDMTGVIAPGNANPVNSTENAPLKDVILTDGHAYDYELRTPDKWTFSVAGVIDQTAIISLDYELTDYGKMKLSEDDGYSIAYQNEAIGRHFKQASTVRIGAEVRLTNQWALRAGYAWMESPVEKNVKEGNEEIMTVGSISHFALEGDRHNITYGIGYRFTPNVYLDLGFLMSSQKDDLYSFSNVYSSNGQTLVNSDKASLKTNKFQGMMTLGFKF